MDETGEMVSPDLLGARHSFIKAAMREHEAIFALELSGHYYYADLHSTGNGLRTLVELARLVCKRDRPLSALLKPMEGYALNAETKLDSIACCAGPHVHVRPALATET